MWLINDLLYKYFLLLERSRLLPAIRYGSYGSQAKKNYHTELSACTLKLYGFTCVILVLRQG